MKLNRVRLNQTKEIILQPIYSPRGEESSEMETERAPLVVKDQAAKEKKKWEAIRRGKRKSVAYQEQDITIPDSQLEHAA